MFGFFLSKIFLISSELLEDCKILDGRPIQIGFRPEHMRLESAKSTSKGNISISGKIRIVEPMGHETILICDGGFGEIVGKNEGENRFEPGQIVHFHIRSDLLHYFDLKTGIRL